MRFIDAVRRGMELNPGVTVGHGQLFLRNDGIYYNGHSACCVLGFAYLGVCDLDFEDSPVGDYEENAVYTMFDREGLPVGDVWRWNDSNVGKFRNKTELLEHLSAQTFAEHEVVCDKD